MRILVIADTYVPERISGAVQLHNLTVELVRQGHQPTVITPASKLGRSWLIEKTDHVEVLRVRALRTKDVAYVRRTLAELLLPFFLLRGLSRSSLSGETWDGVIWYSPTIFLGPMVRWLKRRQHIKSYLILRDLFPDWALDSGVIRQGLIYRFLKWVERYQYRVADVIGVQASGNIPLVRATVGRDDVHIEVLENWLAESKSERPSLTLNDTALAGRKIFVYAGNMGRAQGMDCLLELALSLRKRNDAGFLFVGRGSEMQRLRDMAVRENLGGVVFMDEIDPDLIPGLLSQCHVGLIALDPRHSTHNIPGKFLTYLRAGLPVLARVNGNNDLVHLIDDTGVGYVCTDESGDHLRHLAEKLLDTPGLIEEMGQRGRTLAETRYSVASAARQVVGALEVVDWSGGRAQSPAP